MNDKVLWEGSPDEMTSWEPGDTTILAQHWHYAPSGWISVSDPPKTAGTHWLIWHGGRGAWMDAVWRDDSWWDSIGQIHNVTHYMPGPSAPEDVSHD